jgi:5-methylcytosine-specific restriction endonuclease McrA
MSLIQLKVGSKVGRLTVVQKLNKRSLYLFRCTCGKEVKAISSRVSSGNTTSCGCLRQDTCSRMGSHWGKINGGKYQKPKLKKGIDAAHRLRRSYMRYARKRKLLFGLSESDFIRLTSQDCFYCGRPPASVARGRQKKFRSDYVYNGLDRINNRGNYDINNVVPCCYDCNKAKGARTKTEFLAWIKTVASRFK